MDQENRAIKNAMAMFKPAPRLGIFTSYGQAARFLLFWAALPWLIAGFLALFLIRW